MQDCAGVALLTPDHPAVVAMEERRRISSATAISLHDLSSLCFSGCRHMQGRTLVKVLTWCDRLHELQLSECTALVEDDLLSALPRQASLHSLNLAKLPHLLSVDQVVAAVARACPDLIYLNLSGTRCLTDGMLALSSAAGRPKGKPH
jgi:hypothetical protein